MLDLADNKVNLAVRSWVRTADYWQARCDVLEQVKDRFGEAGIEVPYPKQELRLYQDVRRDAGLPQQQSR